MYNWRKLTAVQRQEVLALRRGRNLPWHSPPHLDLEGVHQYLVSAACFDHAAIIGASSDRMTEFEAELLTICNDVCLAVHGWCILPNHYHLVVKTELIKELRRALGMFHGRSSFAWNGEEQRRGRQVWYNCFERPIKSRRHFWATLNYVHHNPVHHGYVERWQDWPWSSAALFLENVGKTKAVEIWNEYPILDFGKKWDI